MSATEFGVRCVIVDPTSPANFYMYRVCSWCHASMGTKPCGREDHLQVTNGICPKCVKMQQEMVDALLVQQVTVPPIGGSHAK
jgi:hypothetical protein